MTLGSGVLIPDEKNDHLRSLLNNLQLEIIFLARPPQQSVDREGRSDTGEVELAPKGRQQSNSNPHQTNLFFFLSQKYKNYMYESQVSEYIKPKIHKPTS